MISKLSCITCRVIFKDNLEFSSHFKSEWHRYNTKRKIVNYPPITQDAFNLLVETKAKEAETKEKEATFCIYCKKTFSTIKTYENHLESKKHKQALKQEPIHEVNINKNKNSQINDSVEDIKEYRKNYNGLLLDSDEWESCSEEEELDDDEIIDDSVEIITGKIKVAIKESNCLFCSKNCGTLQTNIDHMAKRHFFFIPYPDYLIDKKGLLMYLHEKIRLGHMCLWCNDKSKMFRTTLAAQKHMIAKQHCKMKCEKSNYMEYIKFYDFSKIYPEDFSDSEEEEDNKDSKKGFRECELGLVLPSGSIILDRWSAFAYKQHLLPRRDLPRKIVSSKAIGWGSQPAIAKKNIATYKTKQAKYYMKLGVKANKLQTHFRPQVLF